MKRRDYLVLAAASACSKAFADVADLGDAINKAGRQRMLCERMAKSYLAHAMGVEPELADRTLMTSIALFERQLGELKAYATQPVIRDACDRLDSAWQPYRKLLGDRAPGPREAADVLACADRVLALAQDGTVKLVALSTRATSRWVNTSGRQRMLSQRLAALYFGSSWGVETASAQVEMARASAEFVTAQALLAAAPEATPAIREQLQLADVQWTFFDTALRKLRPGVADRESMSHVFTTSERILEVMDGVTGQFAKLG